MKSGNKENKCHSKNGSHKGHGWMMLLCMAIMVGILFFILSPTVGGFNIALLGAAIIPIVLCLVMIFLMVNFMMPSPEKDNEKQESSSETKRIEEASKSNNQFKP
tara:strand:+ start:38121 stop:38435 length:315 start_codon:yes stop_codon:yes gene_type:complete